MVNKNSSNKSEEDGMIEWINEGNQYFIIACMKSLEEKMNLNEKVAAAID